MSKSRSGAAWKSDIERRLTKLEQELREERADRERAGALDDEEFERIAERLGSLEDDTVLLFHRTRWLERRFDRRGRPPGGRSKPRKKTAQ
jgi:hypothetical protein